MAHAWINNLSPRDLLKRAKRHVALLSHTAPLTLGGLKPVDNEVVKGLYHGSNANPICGVMQPDNGVQSAIRYSRMGRPTKPKRYRTPLAAILGENIVRRLPDAFPNHKTPTSQIGALASRTGIAAETIRRTAAGLTMPTLTKIERIAAGLGCHVWEMFRPFYESHAMDGVQTKDKDDVGRRTL